MICTSFSFLSSNPLNSYLLNYYLTQRETLARHGVDDLSRRNRVAFAREIIYEKKYAVDSNAVENILQVDSLVPTAVRGRWLLNGYLRR
jgi:hypothetical protein